MRLRVRVCGLFGPDAMKGQTIWCQRTVLVVHSPVMMANTLLGTLADRWGRRAALNPLPGEWQRLSRVGTRPDVLVLTGHDNIDEARTDLRHPGRSSWV
jgi:hypothetical protein